MTPANPHTKNKDGNHWHDASTVPGSSIAAIGDGQLDTVDAAGLRSSRAATRVDTHTRFQAASLSKTVNALAVLCLVRDGKIRMGQPVNHYLKRWQLSGTNAQQVTIKALLSHTGGTNVHGFAGYENGTAIPDLIEVLSGTGPANNEPVQVTTRPNSDYRYSGGGVTVLQAMLEDVSQSTYEDYVAQMVLKPLGMTHSFMGAPPPSITNLAVGHGPQGLPIRGRHRMHPEMAAAGLWSTPSDFARVLITIRDSLRGQSNGLLTPASARELITPVMQNAALGTFCDEQGRLTHSGSNRGYRSLYVFDANVGRGIVVMANGENAQPINAQRVNDVFD